MTITITEKEYNAISFAINQIESQMETANDNFVDIANTNIKELYKVVEKYKKARESALYFQSIRAEISKRNPRLRARDVDALTRKYIKSMKG